MTTTTQQLLLDQAKALIQAIATGSSSHERVQICKVAISVFQHDQAVLQTHLHLATPVLVHCLRRAVMQCAWTEVQGLATLLLTCLEGRSHDALLSRQLYGHLVLTGLTTLQQGPSATAGIVATLLTEVARFPVSLDTILQKAVTALQSTCRDCNTYPLLFQTSMQLLVGLAQPIGNKIFLMQRPGLVEAVLEASVESAPSTVPSSLMVAKFWKHLAWETRNRAAMIDTKGFLSHLSQLSETGDLSTRLDALTTLRRLAMSAGCRRVKIVQVSGILRALLVATQHDHLQLQAVTTLLCLIAPDTLSSMLSSELVACFMAMAMPDESCSSESQQCSVIAAHCIQKLSANVTVGSKYHSELVDAVLLLAQSMNPEVRKMAASALLGMSKHLCTGFVLVRDDAVMSTINALANDDQVSVKALATESLVYLLSNAANLKRIMAKDDILCTMIDNSQHWCAHTSRQAIQCILTLVDYAPLRARVAKQLDLVACLSQFGVADSHGDDDMKLKQAALQGVIVLAPLL